VKYVLGHAQHQGDRHSQQDAFGFLEPPNAEWENHAGYLAIVADGMGGMEHGDVASHTAVDRFIEAYKNKTPQETIQDALERALAAANQAVVDFSKQAGTEEGTGTTFIAAVIHKERLFWVSVGDSHLYVFRRGELKLLSHPHVFANLLSRAVAAGHLSQEEADRHPERESLTSFVGSSHLEEIDRSHLALEPGDTVLIASDGLFKTLGHEEIIAHLTGEPSNWAQRLVDKTLDRHRPQQDNITVVTVTLPGEPRPAPVDTQKTRTQEIPAVPEPSERTLIDHPAVSIPASEESHPGIQGGLYWFPLVLLALAAALGWALSQMGS
jgi:protein phosphatase